MHMRAPRLRHKILVQCEPWLGRYFRWDRKPQDHLSQQTKRSLNFCSESKVITLINCLDRRWRFSHKQRDLINYRIQVYAGWWSRLSKVCKVKFLCIPFAGLWIHNYNSFYYLKTPYIKKKKKKLFNQTSAQQYSLVWFVFLLAPNKC
jgi:hypothetical protein